MVRYSQTDESQGTIPGVHLGYPPRGTPRGPPEGCPLHGTTQQGGGTPRMVQGTPLGYPPTERGPDPTPEGVHRTMMSLSW